jgi:DNA-binding XRE family transcriptional regulator
MNKLQESREDRSLSTRSLAATVGINHMDINYYENSFYIL